MTPARIAQTLIAASLVAFSATPRAGIQYGDATAESAAAGTNLPELLLVVWDPVAEVSYTKDLGVFTYFNHYAAGDTSKNLFVHGQQDAGYQKLYDPLNDDPIFQTFLSQSTGTKFWGIIAGETDAEKEAQAGFRSIFITLNSGDQPTGQRNPHYTQLVGTNADGTPAAAGIIFNNSQLNDVGGDVDIYRGQLNTGVGTPHNTHKCSLDPSPCSGANANLQNGSSFDLLQSPGYAGFMFTNMALEGSTGAGNIFNPVGRSSWFYSVTISSEVSDAALIVDEFDNLSHDAYWGLGVNADGEYILSYTLEAHLSQPQTAAGSLLRLNTDFAARYGRTRLIELPVLAGNVSAVPEPSTWGLMGLGVALLAARARRRA
jgi:hypothetical protein